MISRDMRALDAMFPAVWYWQDIGVVMVHIDAYPMKCESGKSTLAVKIGPFNILLIGDTFYVLSEISTALSTRGLNKGCCHPYVDDMCIDLGQPYRIVERMLSEGEVFSAFMVVSQVLHRDIGWCCYASLDEWN